MAPSILVTGGNGMLAWDLARSFEKAFPGCALRAPGKDQLDITSEDSLHSALSTYRPQWVLNAAAYTSVDGAEGEKEKAESINSTGPQYLAEQCRAFGAKLVHFSTDQVFDGTVEHPRTEDEIPTPCNAYGASKLLGEAPVLREPGNLVLRVQWLYGEKKDRFSPLRQRKIFTPFADQWGAPAWTRKIAETVASLLQKEASGLFHFSYDDHATWAEVFQFVKEQWHLDLVLEPKKTQEMALPARRPLYSVLSNRKLKEALGVDTMGSWKTPLKEFLAIV